MEEGDEEEAVEEEDEEDEDEDEEISGEYVAFATSNHAHDFTGSEDDGVGDLSSYRLWSSSDAEDVNPEDIASHYQRRARMEDVSILAMDNHVPETHFPPGLGDPGLWMVKTRDISQRNRTFEALMLMHDALAAGPVDETQAADQHDLFVAGTSGTQATGTISPMTTAHTAKTPAVHSISLCVGGMHLDHADHIYIEAQGPIDVARACSMATHLLRQIKPLYIPLDERISTFSIGSTNIRAHTFTRLQFGRLYKGDLTYIEDVQQGVVVWAVPRVSYGNKRSLWPAARPFDPAAASEHCGHESVKKKSRKGKGKGKASSEMIREQTAVDYIFRGKRFRDGLVRLKYETRYLGPLIPAPSEDDIEPFVGPDWIPQKAIEDMIHLSNMASLSPHDCIRVTGGELSGLEGVIDSVTDRTTTILYGRDSAESTVVSLGSLERIFKPGDAVKVLRGSHHGTTGFVLASKPDVSVLSVHHHEHENIEITVRTHDMKMHSVPFRFVAVPEEVQNSHSPSEEQRTRRSAAEESDAHKAGLPDDGPLTDAVLEPYIMHMVAIIRGGHKGYRGLLKSIYRGRLAVELGYPRCRVVSFRQEEVGLLRLSSISSDKGNIYPLMTREGKISDISLSDELLADAGRPIWELEWPFCSPA
ncbi:uncharacterized protein LAESUDRAFT_717405 [Laetiporus sulphureus 93-53]|uniref:KOW domain-containing protein n=1 Tax=Laetiporus sulphureus 93-53 TaxID=1314785 RepID=A0A165BR16_9APHY|nr:uncharacterized protein LAESUDRAFT_717405 [Laetiporus sulphureus 93-53]KZT01497.1 hypothetical protein LAESUDRAFT_717405 [Laetiporus sulphureus 93-53]